MATPRIRTRWAGQGDRITDPGVQKWINVFGDVQVIKNIGRLKTAMERKILRKAIGKGLIPIRKLAKQNVPVDEGLLKKSIKSKVTKMVSGKVYVDPKIVNEKGDKPAKYAHLIEFGTKHSKAEPFMRPAVDAGRNEALKIIEQTAKDELSKLKFNEGKK